MVDFLKFQRLAKLRQDYYNFVVGDCVVYKRSNGSTVYLINRFDIKHRYYVLIRLYGYSHTESLTAKQHEIKICPKEKLDLCFKDKLKSLKGYLKYTLNQIKSRNSSEKLSYLRYEFSAIKLIVKQLSTIKRPLLKGNFTLVVRDNSQVLNYCDGVCFYAYEDKGAP